MWNDKEIKYLKVLREETDLDWREITDEMNEQFSGKRTLNATRKAYKRYQDDEISDDVLIKNISRPSVHIDSFLAYKANGLRFQRLPSAQFRIHGAAPVETSLRANDPMSHIVVSVGKDVAHTV